MQKGNFGVQIIHKETKGTAVNWGLQTNFAENKITLVQFLNQLTTAKNTGTFFVCHME